MSATAMAGTDEELARAVALAAAPGAPRAEAHAAFREIYDRHKDELFSFLARLLRDDALAEDVLQDAFLRVHRSIDRYDASRPFRAWIYEIARNAALDALRRRKKQEKLATAAASAARAADEPVLPEVARREAIARARGALDTLPDDARALLLQRHGHGMKLEELAASFSVTERTVRNRLRDAATLLAKAVLEKSGEKGGAS